MKSTPAPSHNLEKHVARQRIAEQTDAIELARTPTWKCGIRNQSESTSRKTFFLSYYLPVPQKSINPPTLPSTRKNHKHSYSTPLVSCPVLSCIPRPWANELHLAQFLPHSNADRPRLYRSRRRAADHSEDIWKDGKWHARLGFQGAATRWLSSLPLWAKEMRDERDEVPNVPPPSFSFVPTSHDMSSFLALRISLNLLLYNGDDAPGLWNNQIMLF